MFNGAKKHKRPRAADALTAAKRTRFPRARELNSGIKSPRKAIFAHNSRCVQRIYLCLFAHSVWHVEAQGPRARRETRARRARRCSRTSRTQQSLEDSTSCVSSSRPGDRELRGRPSGRRRASRVEQVEARHSRACMNGRRAWLTRRAPPAADAMDAAWRAAKRRKWRTLQVRFVVWIGIRSCTIFHK